MSLPIETDCAAVKALLDKSADFLLLDCREEDEYATARIDGALLLPMSELQDRVGELDPHKARHVVVHCHHGGRSLRVAAWLRQQGFPHAQSMAGGIDHWAQSIDPRIPRY
jgi:rhodanese-related sulfurtransferase